MLNLFKTVSRSAGKNNFLKVLKLTALYTVLGFMLQALFVNLLLASSPTEAQNLRDIRVKLNIVNVSLEQALQLIEQKTDFKFNYIKEEIPLNERATVTVEDESLYNILEVFAKDYGLTFNRINNQITVKKSYGQTEHLITAEETGTVKGKVTDASTKEPLIGATVTLKGTTIGSYTDGKGYYTIDNIKPGKYTIAASYVSYSTTAKTIQVEADKTAEINFQLGQSVVNLDEVTVTGSMSERSVRESAINVATITQKDLGYRNLSNLSTVLSQLSSTDYTAFTDQVNSIQRGYKGAGGISANIRGFSPAGIGFTGGSVKYLLDGAELFDGTQVNLLNPNDIEKIEVLSGPMATSIYGMGSAGGVISITTKKETGKAKIGLKSMFTSISDPLQVSDPLITDYTIYYGASKPDFGFHISAELYKSSNSRYAIASPQDEKFTTIGGQLNGVVDNIKIDLRLDYTNGITGYAFQNYWYEIGRRDGWTGYEKLVTSFTDTRYKNNTLNGILNLSQPLTNNLYHKLTVGYSGRNSAIIYYNPKQTSGSNYYSETNQFFSTTNLNYFLNLNQPITDDFKMDLTVGYYYNKQVPEVISGQWSVLPEDYSAATWVGTGGGAHNIYVVSSNALFIDAVLGLWNDLFLTTGYRAEKNTSIGANQEWSSMPRVGLTYVTNLGDFTIKPRIAWGRSLQAVSPIYSQGLTIGTLRYIANPDLKPQNNSGYEVGVDLFYGNNYSLSLTYFDQKIGDYIQMIALTSTTAQAQNYASVLNKGLEVNFKTILKPFTLNITTSTISSHYGPGNRISSSASTAYLDEGNRVIQVPSGKLYVKLTYDIPALLPWSDIGGSISLDYKYNGGEKYGDYYKYYKIYAGTGKYPTMDYTEIDGYSLIGLQFNYSVLNNLALFCDVTNLLNNQKVVSGMYGMLQGRKINFGFNVSY